ncbi:MAG: non-hydrolyzing UDP-N-acetylglucosamine 2-epimerase [Acidimicrobiia bacterium]
MRVFCVGGARPNFPKLKPVVEALDDRGVDTAFVHTGQHYDEAMSSRLLEELGLRPPDHFLGVGSGSHATQTARVMERFEPLVERERPDVVVVVGDVNSTVACALVAAKAGVLVAHVEAGLRSRDWTMPEEVNRAVTDRLSDYLFAPSPDAATNLRAEGYRDDQISVVGNVMIDSVLANRERATARPILRELGLVAGQYGVVTLHRPSNVDDDATFAGLIEAVTAIARDLPLVFPVHPRTRQRLSALLAAHGAPPLGLVVSEPAGYLDFLALQSQAALVLTDSGGVQEETTALGVPCLTLRSSTERPITVTDGTNRLVGTEPAAIVREASEVLHDLRHGGWIRRCPPLWDGNAAQRIADVIVHGGTALQRRRPTDLPLKEH